MARIGIVDGQLHVRMQGVHRVLAFKSALMVPLEHVHSVTVRPDLRQWGGGGWCACSAQPSPESSSPARTTE